MPYYDPYEIMNQPKSPPEYNERGDSVNGFMGSRTSGSLRNAAINSRTPSGGGGNVFAEMVQYGKKPVAASARRRPARVSSPSIPGAQSVPSGGVASISRYNPLANPFRSPGEGPPAPPGSTTPFYGPRPSGGRYEDGPLTRPVPYNGNPFDPSNPGVIVTYRGPNGEYGGGRPATPSTQPPFGSGLQEMPRTRKETRYDPATGSTYEVDVPDSGPPITPGTPFYGTGSMPNGGFGTGGYSVVNPMALDQPFNSPYFDQSRGGGSDEAFGDRVPSPANRPPGTPSTQPTPNRPPATPSTQPVPTRPPATPSTQPVSPYQQFDGPPMVTYVDPRTGSTTGRNPNQPSGSFQPFDFDFGYGPGVTPAFAPPGTTPTGPTTGRPMGGGRSGGGISPGLPSFQPPPQSTPSGPQFGTGGIGRRYGPGYGGAPIAAPGEQGAGGTAPTMYEWKDGKLVPVTTPGSSATVTPPATGTAPPSTGTSTTTGQYAAPNNTTTFDPSILPQSDAGKWLDPVFRDTLDEMTRQLRHEGSLTGATNSGGFIPGLTDKLAPVANQFAAQKSQLMFQDQQAKADRLLDKYKFDNTQQLTEWIKQNEFELQKAGIDANILIGKYQADKQLSAAGLGASASMYGADAAANASRNNAWLDFMQGMYGIDANTALGQQQLGYNYWNSNNQYNLGLYGTDVDRENNIMNYLSRIYGMSPDFLRLMLQGDPSQLIPGMSPGNTVTIT